MAPLSSFLRSILRLAVLMGMFAQMVACQNIFPVEISELPNSDGATPAPETVGADTSQEQVEPVAEEETLTVIYSDIALTDRLARVASNYGANALPATSLGYYLDVQFASLQFLAQSGVEVERRSDHIYLFIPGSESFDSNGYVLLPTAEQLLDKLARLLVEYDQSLVSIKGYSNDLEDPQKNLSMSLNRAIAVGNYLAASGVGVQRMTVRGLGSDVSEVESSEEVFKKYNQGIEVTLWPLVTM